MTQRTRPDTLLIAIGVALGGAALSGCIASPADGTVVNSTAQTLHFSGFHPYARAPVRVKAYNFSTRRYDVIGSGVSTSSPIPAAYWDDTLYEWWAPSRTLPSAYWQSARCTGARALITGETEVSGRTYGLYSWDLEKNGQGCMTENPNNSDWVANCAANESEIKTRDYSDAPRAFGVNVNSAFNIDNTCASVIFYYSFPQGEWSNVSASYRQGGSNRGLTCSDTRTTSGRTYGSCRINLGSRSAMRSFIEWHRSNDGQLTMRARDARCRDNLTASRAYTLRSSRYDYSWSRWTGLQPECAAPPPPPPTTDPRWHDISCYCSNVGGAASSVALRGCLNAAASSPATGASLMCGYAARDLERLSGLSTSCQFTGLGSPTTSCSPAGTYIIAP